MRHLSWTHFLQLLPLETDASHGLEALQALVTQKEAQGADKAMYVCLGALTEQAGRFARERG